MAVVDGEPLGNAQAPEDSLLSVGDEAEQVREEHRQDLREYELGHDELKQAKSSLWS